MVDRVRILLFDEPLANLDPATGKQAAEVLEFKSPSATGLTNKQIQLHMTTSTNVTGVKLVDGEGQEIPSTADSINADDETIRIWTIGVLFSQPFDGELYAAVCENDVWTTTDKKISLTISEATVQTQAPVEEATTEPTQAPTQEPTKEPTQEPTLEPTPEATDAPTQAPTQVPASIVMSEATVEPTQDPTQEPTEVPTQAPTQEPTEVPTQAPTQEPTPEPTQAPTPTPEPLTASGMEGTEPGEIGLKETVFIGSESQKDYSRENVYAAPAPDQYAYNNETGVYTFRGDNFRRNAAFGTAEVTDGQMDVLWSYELGSLRTNDSGTLYGVGWNNQPAIIKWTKEVREMMNLNEEAKAVTGLREVIFSAQDGNVYFLNLTTGDQFISIVLTADMYRDAYRKQGYESRLLSRTTEDVATVTSVLIPWNTCGMTQAAALGVPTLVYLPYSFFNLISPFMTLLVAAIGWKIKKTPGNEAPDCKNS